MPHTIVELKQMRDKMINMSHEWCKTINMFPVTYTVKNEEHQMNKTHFLGLGCKLNADLKIKFVKVIFVVVKVHF